MRSSWHSTTIQDFVDRGEAELKTGPFGTQLHASDYVEAGIPLINVRNIGFATLVPEKLEFISEETVNRLRSHLLQTNDIVFGRKGAVERHLFVKEKQYGWFQGSDCLRLRVSSPSLLPRFLSYYLLTDFHKRWITSQCSHGATMASLNQAIIRRIHLRLPDVEAQKRIVAELSSYDDLIENNTRRIKILEEMAQLIYREWFVNFRFPGHEKVKMVESELGPIPEGWSVVGFDAICHVLSGGTPKTTEPAYWDGAISFFGPTDAPDAFFVLNTARRITELGLSKCNSKLYPAETVFITARGTVGKVILSGCDMAMNQSCYALRGKPGINQLALFLMTRECANQLKKKAHGAVFDTITVETFQKLRVVRPLDPLLERFELVARPMFALLLNLLKRTENLRTTRDLLLPKLISGDIDVEALQPELVEQTV